LRIVPYDSLLGTSCRKSALFRVEEFSPIQPLITWEVFRVAFQHAVLSFLRLSFTGLRVIPRLAARLPSSIDLGDGLKPAYPVAHKEDAMLRSPSLRQALGVLLKLSDLVIDCPTITRLILELLHPLPL